LDSDAEAHEPSRDEECDLVEIESSEADFDHLEDDVDANVGQKLVPTTTESVLAVPHMVLVPVVPFVTAPQASAVWVSTAKPVCLEAPLSDSSNSAPGEAARSTLMLRNLPETFTRDALCSLLNAEVGRCYDFVYVPRNMASGRCIGYAFVSFTRPRHAEESMRRLQGFRSWGVTTDKVLEVVWSEQQGLEAQIERYRSSPVMHSDVPDEYKPILLKGGVRVSFPPPTKPLLAPKLRKSSGIGPRRITH
jgi:hypothetical protein